MLNKLKKSNAKGFTIIEVMIVLAIAGLIILIVLLAVPALQRNGRNTAIKNDASAIAGALSEFRSNNDGKSPQVYSQATGSSLVVFGATSDTQSNAKVQADTKIISFGTYTTGTAWPTNNGEIGVYRGAKCNDAGSGLQASTRGMVVLYNIETSGGGLSNKCIDA